jgi:hypothetical protein
MIHQQNLINKSGVMRPLLYLDARQSAILANDETTNLYRRVYRKLDYSIS